MKSFKKIIILLFTTFLSFFELLANEKKLEVVTLIESSEATLKILDKNTVLNTIVSSVIAMVERLQIK